MYFAIFDEILRQIVKKGNFCIVVGVERNVVEKVKLPIRNWGVAEIGVAGLTKRKGQNRQVKDSDMVRVGAPDNFGNQSISPMVMDG